YEVLGDPEKRRKYDELGANWRMYEQAGAQGAGAGGPQFRTAGGTGGFRTMTEEEMREMFGDGDPFSDFFHTFFGGVGFGGGEAGRRSRPHRARARQGRDV